MKKQIGKQITLFEEIEKKIIQSTSTVTELRVPIFMPVKRIAHNSRLASEFKKNGNKLSFKTAWGEVTIRGRTIPTDTHRDIQDAILSYNTETVVCQNGEVEIYFNLTKILKHYGQKNPNANLVWLKSKIEEIRDTTIEFKNNKKEAFDFNIFSNLAYSEEKSMYRVTLDKRYVKFYENELSINYKKELPKLYSIDSSLIKTIIRWFFTHKAEQNFKLSTVLEAIGIKEDMLSVRMKQSYIKEIKDNKETLGEFGVSLDPDNLTFHYVGNSNVLFIPALQVTKNVIGNKKDCSNENKEIDLENASLTILLENAEYRLKKIRKIYNDETGKIIKAIVETLDDKEFELDNKADLTEQEFIQQIMRWIRENNKPSNI